MPSQSDSYGDRKRDDADVRYDIATPFNPRGNDAEILLFDEEDTVEIIVHRIPDPTTYYINYPNTASDELNPDTTEDKIRENEVADWIIEESLEILSEYEPEKSDYTTNSGNRYINDIHFTCGRNEVNEAVLDAKEFLNELEKKRFRQQQKYQENVGRSPKKDLS
jgi:hypothetical protein